VGDEFALRNRRQAVVEIGVVAGSLTQGPAVGAHADRRPCLGARDVDAEHRGAILALQRPHVACRVQDDDGHGAIVVLAGQGERGFDDLVGLFER